MFASDICFTMYRRLSPQNRQSDPAGDQTNDIRMSTMDQIYAEIEEPVLEGMNAVNYENVESLKGQELQRDSG